MFDVKKHLIKVLGGRQYLPVAARLIWFRTEHPDWGIDTRAIALDVEKQYAVFEASVYNAEGKLMAKGTKLENIHGFGDWLEKAETGAIGRALAVCGFGTQFAPDLDEAHNGNIADERPRIGYARDRGYMNGRHAENGENYRPYPHQTPGLSQTTNETLSIVSSEFAGATDAHTAERLPAPINKETCDSCSATLKPNQLSLSLRKFGSALCPDCQRKRKLEQAA